MGKLEILGARREESRKAWEGSVVDALIDGKKVFYGAEEVTYATDEGMRVGKEWIRWEKIERDMVTIGKPKGPTGDGGLAKKAA